MNISEKIKEIRKEKRISQRELATRLGVNQSNIVYFEGRGNSLTVEQCISIATALEVSVKELIFGDSEELSVNHQILKNDFEREYAAKMEMLELKLETEKSKKENANANCKVYERELKNIADTFFKFMLENLLCSINSKFDYGAYTDEEYKKIIKHNEELAISFPKYIMDKHRIFERIENEIYNPKYYSGYVYLADIMFMDVPKIDFVFYFENRLVTDKNLINLWYIRTNQWFGEGKPPAKPQTNA